MFLYQRNTASEQTEELIDTNQLAKALNCGMRLSRAQQSGATSVGAKLDFDLHDPVCQVTKNRTNRTNGENRQSAEPAGCNGNQCAKVEISIKPGNADQVPKDPFNPPRLLLPEWPSASSIRSALLRHADRQAHPEEEFQGFEECSIPIISPAEASALASSLSSALNQTLEDYEMPEHLMDMLGRENDFLAQETLNSLPPDQRNRLGQAVDQEIIRMAKPTGADLP